MDRFWFEVAVEGRKIDITSVRLLRTDLHDRLLHVLRYENIDHGIDGYE